MSYTILNTDGTTLVILADSQVDKSATSLTLIGRNYSSYGEELNNNFIKLLANSANSSGRPPRSPLTGQLWYDTTIKRLKVYDNGFKTIGAVSVASSQPTNLQTGDLWWDSSNQQLKIYSGNTVYNVGPIFPSGIGETGWILPQTTITDQDDAAKDVILLKSYGNTIGVAYYDPSGNDLPFLINSNDQSTYIPNATTSTIVSGVTFIGDVSIQGKVTNNYLSFAVDLDVISPNPNNDALAYGGTNGTSTVAIQNPAIAQLLDKMFPPNATTATTSTTIMSGVYPGSQARVLCKYSSIDGTLSSGYQVRVFRTVGAINSSSWQPYYFTTATIGGSDNVPINYIG